MAKNIFSLIRKVDIFGRDLMFEEHNTQAYKTYMGAALSILTFITVIVIGMLFGKEIYERKTPIVIESEELQNSTRINISDYPILINFRGDSVRRVDPQTFLDISLFVLNMNLNNTLKPLVNTVGLNAISPCNPDNYTYGREFVRNSIEQAGKDKDYVSCFSMTDKVHFQNPYNTPNSTFIAVVINHCNETKRKLNPSLPQCLPLEQRKELVSKAYLRIDYLNIYISPNNFGSPIVEYKDSMTFQIHNDITKMFKIRFVKNLLESDNGWMIQDNQRTEYIAFKSFTEEITNFGESNQIMTLVIESSPIRKKTQRNYMKVQDLFAKVGGLFNACVMISNLLLYDYIRFKFRINYFKYISPESYSYNNSNSNDSKNSNDNFNIVKSNTLKKINLDNYENNYDKGKKETKDHECSVIPNNNNQSLNEKNKNLKSINGFKSRKNTKESNLNNINEGLDSHLKDISVGMDRNSSNKQILTRSSKNLTVSMVKERNNTQKNKDSNNNNLNSKNINLNGDKNADRLESINPLKDNYLNSEDNCRKKSFEANKQLKNLSNNKDNKIQEERIDNKEKNEKVNMKLKKVQNTIDYIAYFDYVVHRLFVCCIKEDKTNKFIKLLISPITREKYSLSHYLQTITKFERLFNLS